MPSGYAKLLAQHAPKIAAKFRDALRKEQPDLWATIPADAWRREWVSFCKHYGRGNDAVLNYLSRYVFRTAISNARILGMDQTHVTFRWKDRNSDTWQTERIPGVEFLRRFLQHVLPRGFHRCRYYGLWHSSKRDLSRCALGAFFRRIRSRLGSPKAITATAQKLAKIVYNMLKYGRNYVDVGAEYYEQKYRQRVLKNLARRAAQFNLSLVPTETT